MRELNMSKKLYHAKGVHENPKKLILTFNSVNETANYFNCSRRTISSYIDSDKLYKKEWFTALRACFNNI
jgi:hypothetical protein